MKIQLCGQMVHLLPQKALYWEEGKLLAVSDIHLGKAATFQRAGIAVPEGAMQTDLNQLMQLICSLPIERCVIVGDLIHAQEGLTSRVDQLIDNWLNEVPCHIDLVFGNHDRPLLKQLPTSWKLTPHVDHLILDPFAFFHHPQEVAGFYVWSGHLHPQYVLKAGTDRLRLPCFHLKQRSAVLPAFSSFVGGYNVIKANRDRIFVTTGKEVIEV